MFMLTLTLLFSAIICYIVLLATYKPQAKYRSGMLFAVTLPEEALEHEGIRGIQARFQASFNKASIGMGLGLIPFLILYQFMSVQVLYFFVWLVGSVIVMVLPFRRAFWETLALKREHEWFVGHKRVILTDLRVSQLKNQRSASLWLYVIPFLMVAGLLLWAIRGDAELYAIAACGFLLTALFFGFSLYIRRMRTKVYSMNTEVNLVLNQARRRSLSYLWLWMAIAENIHLGLLCLLLLNENPAMDGVWLAVILLFTAIPVGSLLYVYRKINTLEQEILSRDGKIVYTDEDEYWSNGFTYHNPYDKSIFMPKRVGIGETVNTATPVGKLIVWGAVGMTAVLILGVTFMMIRSELTSPALAITSEHSVEIKYPMYSYDFSIDDIQELTLVDSIPSGAKTNGEATGKYARGYFRLKELGKSRLYIFKDKPPYIRIKLDSGYIFYNEKEPGRTRELFEQLRKQAGLD